MSLLKDILHAATGIAGHAAQNALHAGESAGHVIQQAAGGGDQGVVPHLESGIPGAGAVHKAMDEVQHRQPLPRMQYAQYINPDGSGGGFGATNPSLLRQHLSDAMPQFAAPNMGGANPNLQGTENPGYIPLQNSGMAQPGANPYATGLQPTNAAWQNVDGQRRNMVNPQVDDNGFYYN